MVADGSALAKPVTTSPIATSSLKQGIKTATRVVGFFTLLSGGSEDEMDDDYHENENTPINKYIFQVLTQALYLSADQYCLAAEPLKCPHHTFSHRSRYPDRVTRTCCLGVHLIWTTDDMHTRQRLHHRSLVASRQSSSTAQETKKLSGRLRQASAQALRGGSSEFTPKAASTIKLG